MITVAQVTDLQANVDLWATRGPDATRAAATRRAGDDIVTAIDGMLAELYLLRGLMVSELRAHDDLVAMRLDARLAERRVATP